jgi:hypothetical protein
VDVPNFPGLADISLQAPALSVGKVGHFAAVEAVHSRHLEAMVDPYLYRLD